jgi:hypothetical protein
MDPVTEVASWLTPTTPAADKSLITLPDTIDPVVALGREWQALEEVEDQDCVDQLTNRVLQIERELARQIPASLEGVLWQVRKLKHLTDFDLENSPDAAACVFPMIDNVIVGIERLIQAPGEAMAMPADADSRILSVFREWMAARRHAGALYVRELPDKEVEKQAWAHVNQLHCVIFDTPAAGVVGLAIKAYLQVHDWDQGRREDGAAVTRDSEDWQGLLKDAVRFVPELAPLAANALKEPDEDEDVDDREEENIEPDVVAPIAGKRALTDAEKDALELLTEWASEDIAAAEKDVGRPLSPAERRLVVRMYMARRLEESRGGAELVGFGEPEGQRLD